MVRSVFHFEFNDLKINASQVERILGYQEGDDRELVSGLIEEILKESENICNIKAEYNIYEDVHLNNNNKSIDVNKINFQVGQIIFGQIKNLDSIAVFLSTAGDEIGVKSKIAMNEKDPLKGFLYDIVGSLVVEAAADLMKNELEKRVTASGKKITNSYSPGYCGWNVGEQHKLFQLVPENYCGIRLTYSALMDPVKSVSGIIAIGEKVKMNPYTCGLCGMKDCIYRKVRNPGQ